MASAVNKRGWNWFRNERPESRSKMPASYSSSSMPAVSYFAPISGFFQDMDRMFENTFRNFGLPTVAASVPGFMGMGASFYPSINIASSDDKYTITVEAPGMEERDIRLNVSPDGMLTVSGEKRQESEDKNKDYEYLESSYGSFQRRLSLPDDVDQEAISADFKNGELTITCPKLEGARAKSRQIPVGAGRGGQERGSQERSSPASAGPKKAA